MGLWLLAIGYACVLIYALAIDPKPRTMFVPFTMTNVALGLIFCRLFRRTRAVVLASCVSSAGLAAILLYAYPSDLMMERSASEWIAEYPNQIEIDENTRRHLALLPAAANLPSVDADRAYLLYRSAEPCDRWIERGGLRGTFTVTAQAPASRVNWLTNKLGPLCLLHYRRQVPGDVVRDAFRRSRDDGPYMTGARAL
jgi:hypothetical protein